MKNNSSQKNKLIKTDIRLSKDELLAIRAKQKLTFSQKASDGLTGHMGSWTFIFSFGFYLVIWMVLNIYGFTKEWDPYPFILLNLTLSCLAAIQAPIILMSQNRQTERDRIRFEHDYAVNRKAEREIQQIQKELVSIRRFLQKNNK